MDVVADASVIIAVISNEPQRDRLIDLTKGADLLAPPSVHWEVGNAFSAMLKRRRITLAQALQAIQVYRQIPIRFVGMVQVRLTSCPQTIFTRQLVLRKTNTRGDDLWAQDVMI